MKIITPIMLAGMLMMSCQPSEKANEAASTKAKTENVKQQTKTLFAFVQVDSLQSNYDFCKDQEFLLKQKQTKYQNRLASLGKKLQDAAMAFDKKLQEGKFSSREEAEKAQKKLQQMQQNLANEQGKAEHDMAKFTLNYRDELQTRLETFLKAFNKDGKYEMIFTNSMANVNILYANPSSDITQEVIDGLNKEYKAKKK